MELGISIRNLDLRYFGNVIITEQNMVLTCLEVRLNTEGFLYVADFGQPYSHCRSFAQKEVNFDEGFS